MAIEDKLTKWRAALNSGTAQVVVIGDSISEGTGATTASNRWVTILERDLNPIGPLFPFIPSDPITPVPGFPVSASGSPAANGTYGLGWRTSQLLDGQSLTFSFVGTSFEVMYTKSSVSGWLNISVDSIPTTTIDTNATRTGGASDAEVWTSPTLPNTSHLVTVSGSSATTEAAYVQGILTYRGDETAGVRVLDAAHHGILSTYLTSTRIGTVSKAVAAAGGADLVIIELGTNDYRDGTTPATFKANIENLIAGLRAGGFAGSVILIGTYLGGGRSLPGWLLLMDTLRQIADADPDIGFFDWRDQMPDVPTPYNAPSGLGLYADTVHPSDKGHAFIAQMMYEVLGSPVGSEKLISDFNALYGGLTIADFNQIWDDYMEEAFPIQAFGNAAGARVHGRDAFFRISTATFTPADVNYTAVLDTMLEDFNEIWDGQNIADFNAEHEGRLIRDFSTIPLRRNV